MFKTSACCLFVCILLPGSIIAEESDLLGAISGGNSLLDFRLRYEDVDTHYGLNNQQEKGAQVATLRSRLTFVSAEDYFFKGMLEFDVVSAFPDDKNYNSGSNSQTDDALVLDPEGAEVNQVWLGYDIANTLIKYGRQRLSFDNGRFIGNEALRQNEQTFSGFSLHNETFNFTRLNFAQLNRIEGILGEDHPDGRQNIDAQIFNIEYRGFLNPMMAFGAQTSLLSLYGYFIDNDSGHNLWDTKTWGIRFATDIKTEPRITYAFEYAVQEDRKDNVMNYSADYQLAELGIVFKGIIVNAGIEILGADKQAFFVTPLASLHDFQGAAGQFHNQGLGNIIGGIRDTQVTFGYICPKGVQVSATFHEFDSDDDSTGAGALGKEWNLKLFKEWQDYRLAVKYADYSKDNYGLDTQKLWLTAEARF